MTGKLIFFLQLVTIVKLNLFLFLIYRLEQMNASLPNCLMKNVYPVHNHTKIGKFSPVKINDHIKKCKQNKENKILKYSL